MIGKTGVDYRAMRVLVALSNKQLGETIWHYLKTAGVGQAQLVGAPKGALDRLTNFSFTHIFVDFDFGDHGGVDFAKFIRMCDGPIAEVPIMMIMPAPNREKVLEARDGGVNEILGLPLTGKQIHDRLLHMAGHPKPFVRGTSYIGPCRRRETMKVYHGPDRRGSGRPASGAGTNPAQELV